MRKFVIIAAIMLCASLSACGSTKEFSKVFSGKGHGAFEYSEVERHKFYQKRSGCTDKRNKWESVLNGENTYN